MSTRQHTTDASRGAISVSLAIVAGLVAVGLVVALLGVVFGFASGGEDTSAVERRIAKLEKQVKTADSEFSDSLSALEGQTARTEEIAEIAGQMVENSNQSVALIGQQLSAGRAGDASTFNTVNDQWVQLRVAHSGLERRISVLIGAG